MPSRSPRFRPVVERAGWVGGDSRIMRRFIPSWRFRPMIRSILVGFIAVAAAAVPASARPQAQDACDCEAQRPATLAVVNNISIPTATIESDTADLVGRLKSLMDKAREQALQKAITDRLLQLEATKRGITATRLIQDEIV